MKINIGKIVLKFFLGIIILALIILIIPLVRGLFIQDLAAVNDTALHLEMFAVPETGNAYYDLEKAAEALVYPSASVSTDNAVEAMITGTSWDGVLVEKLITENREALKQFSDAANESMYQNPSLVDPTTFGPNSKIGNLGAWRRISHLSVLNALMLSRDGKIKQAVDSALDGVRVGELMERSQETSIEYLAALSFKKTGLTALQQISNGSILSYPTPLNQFTSDSDDAIRMFKVEYTFTSKTLNLMKSTDSSVNDLSVLYRRAKPSIWERYLFIPFYFQLNETKQLFLTSTLEGITTLEGACAVQAKEIAWDDVNTGLGGAIKVYFTKNATGIFIHNDLAPKGIFRAIQVRRCEINSMITALQGK